MLWLPWQPLQKEELLLLCTLRLGGSAVWQQYLVFTREKLFARHCLAAFNLICLHTLVQEQLEDVMQELEDLRVKYDAVKADNSTLLLERKNESASSPADRTAADANGDAGTRRALGAADAHLPLPQGIAELQVSLALKVSLVLDPALSTGKGLTYIMAACLEGYLAVRSRCACYVQAGLEHARSERAAAEVGSHQATLHLAQQHVCFKNSMDEGVKSG